VSDTFDTSEPQTVPFELTQFRVEFICKHSCLVSVNPGNIRYDEAQTCSKKWKMMCTFYVFLRTLIVPKLNKPCIAYRLSNHR
jgi:hypothetical protein